MTQDLAVTAPARRLLCAACAGPRAQLDALTGLADRTEFNERLRDALAECAVVEGDPGLVVLLIDLDRFKAVNDSLGHAAGDTLLRAVAGRLRSALREGDVVARLGGDEFAAILSPPLTHAVIAGTAARLVELLARPFLVDCGIANIGASIGAATATGADGLDAETLLRHADLAMYQAKADGRGRHRLFEPGMRERAEARRAIEFELRAALPLGQFELFYQPQMDLTTSRLVGFEALIRWRHPARGLVAPDAFIPLAEELGLIAAIGEWVLRTACAEASTWPAGLIVAVNVAAAQFENGRLVPSVLSALATSGLPGARLELEITETVLLKNSVSTMQQLNAIKLLGAQVSLDDFGTGYSSLTQLRSFPFDRVKIDRSFADDPAVVRAVAALGASLGMRTTAEGVETAEQMSRLKRDGCTEAQGYLLSRPVPASSVAAIIARMGEIADLSPVKPDVLEEQAVS